MEQGKHKESICKEAERLLQPEISRGSDDKSNSIASQETMDTDKCIQKLIRTELEGSEWTQCKIENTAQYWAMKEKEAAINYRLLEPWLGSTYFLFCLRFPYMDSLIVCPN